MKLESASIKVDEEAVTLTLSMGDEESLNNNEYIFPASAELIEDLSKSLASLLPFINKELSIIDFSGDGLTIATPDLGCIALSWGES